MAKAAPNVQDSRIKVVAHKTGGALIKGFIEGFPPEKLQALKGEGPASLPKRLTIHSVAGRRPVRVELKDLKALFFVKSFEGANQYEEVKFFRAHPRHEGLWVRLRFADQEHTEGIVRNSLNAMVEPGFFMKPPDPHSNNEIVYVLKSSLCEFSVLGVRNHY